MIGVMTGQTISNAMHKICCTDTNDTVEGTFHHYKRPTTSSYESV